MLPYIVKEEEGGTVPLQRRVVAALIAENRHSLPGLLRQELNQVSKIAISSEESEVVQLTLVDMLHGLHDNCYVHFGLHLYIEASLALSARLIGAKGLLALESSDVDSEAQGVHLFVEFLTVPDRGFASLRGHVVFGVVTCVG